MDSEQEVIRKEDIYNKIIEFTKETFGSYDDSQDFSFTESYGDEVVRMPEIFADDEEVCSYYGVVDRAFSIGLLSSQFPFLKYTGSFLTVGEYLAKIDTSESEFETELVLSAVICEEITAAYDSHEPHDYELAHYAETYLDQYCEEFDISEEEIEPFIDMILNSHYVIFNLESDQDIPISDVFDIEAKFLGHHDYDYTPGSLQFMPFFVPQVSAEDAKYTKPVDSPKNGQRKLFCDLSECVTEIKDLETIIYVGAYPGYGIDVFAQSRPDLQFFFSDLRKPIRAKDYSENVVWFQNVEEIDYDPETSLFYSDIYEGSDTDETYSKQITYAKRLGCKYNSLKRIVDFRRLRAEKLEGSRLAHQAWRGAAGELRERFVMQEMEEIDFPSSAYERHCSYVDNRVRTTGANVKSKWTGCGCHDCKILQVCLDRAHITAVKGNTLKLTQAKILSTFSLSTKRKKIRYKEVFEDILGRPAGEIRERKDKTVESSFITVTSGSGKEVMFVAPKIKIVKDGVFYDLNGDYQRRKISDRLPMGVKLSLVCEGYDLDISPYQISRVAVAQAVREDMLCSHSYYTVDETVS